MKKLLPLFALTTAILTACPPPPPVGTAIPTTGGSVVSGDATFSAPSAGTGTFVNVSASSDQGQIPSGLTFVKAANFQVTAGSVANATISFVVPAPVVLNSTRLQPAKGANNVYRLYRRDGNFWRYVDGQTNPTSTSVAASVSSYGVYGVLNGIATIKDIVVTPNPLNIVVGQTQQMSAVVRDSLNQPMPALDAPLTWQLQSTYLGAMQPQAVVVAPVAVNSISSTGLFSANKAGNDVIDVITNQNVMTSVPVTISAPAQAQPAQIK